MTPPTESLKGRPESRGFSFERSRDLSARTSATLRFYGSATTLGDLLTLSLQRYDSIAWNAETLATGQPPDEGGEICSGLAAFIRVVKHKSDNQFKSDNTVDENEPNELFKPTTLRICPALRESGPLSMKINFCPGCVNHTR